MEKVNPQSYHSYASFLFYEQGSDCINEFVKMQACIEAHPEVYTSEEEEEEAEGESKAGA